MKLNLQLCKQIWGYNGAQPRHNFKKYIIFAATHQNFHIYFFFHLCKQESNKFKKPSQFTKSDQVAG